MKTKDAILGLLILRLLSQPMVWIGLLGLGWGALASFPHLLDFGKTWYYPEGCHDFGCRIEIRID